MSCFFTHVIFTLAVVGKTFNTIHVFARASKAQLPTKQVMFQMLIQVQHMKLELETVSRMAAASCVLGTVQK
ncbi:hypothetical protein B0H63DRAFT_459918 [Podospora didyma]|uniref:Secreted protein n=1 Tax=Podospora didyma TaxID=330526 RepID=A0AAE0P664_9PEZI|nr:hypothetical protein B0H63DRAFT_459918 [Podospora didyma]